MIVDPLYWLIGLLGALFYWFSPQRFRQKILLLLSFFYLYRLTPIGGTLLAVWTTLFFYISPLDFTRHKYPPVFYLIIGVIGYLILLKYILRGSLFLHTGHLHESILTAEVIQLGVSYYTFKLIHYAAEVRRRGLPSHTFEQFLCYVFFFPIFTAGPIERFDHFLVNQENRWSLNSCVLGLSRICNGLIKKFVIVDIFLDLGFLFGARGETFAGDLHSLQSVEIWLFLCVTYLTLYLDFSAYSDIAIGTARLFGFSIMENFNWPIFASSIVDFWRRWHMTLAKWVQSYVYMPMLGVFRNPVIAVYSSFIIIGLWHEVSMNRLFWGLYHATGIIVCVLWSRSAIKRWCCKSFPNFKVRRILGIVSTQLFLILSMVFLFLDNEKSLIDSFFLLQKMLFIN